IRKRKDDGSPTALEATDNVAFEAGGVSSLFSNVEITWNGKCIESHNGHYQHTSFIRKLFSTSKDVKGLLVQQCGFSRPTCPLVDATEDTNEGMHVHNNA
ncbi:MAG: hypothetical protein GY820_48145, partial [Gammaproteobacteria bacterium]|nr:hypothetical protein [Gammaproteobacteria bacterium]